MRHFRLKIIGKVLIIACILFMAIGYSLSDDWYYQKLINNNKIETPQAVFKWVTAQYKRRTDKAVHSHASPKHLLEKHKTLWCDEGAIIMATLAHKLGYQTRLIDLYGFDDISHHTILEVKEGSEWITYDFTFRLYNEPVRQSSNMCKFALKKAVIKKYPRWYNFVINNNYFIKKMVFFLRGIDENVIEAN